MLDTAEFARWRRSADEARASSEAVSGAGAWNWACFLSEQAAQMAVKALLHGIGESAWGHDLVSLVGRVQQAIGEAVPSDVSDATVRLSRLYVATRYPDAQPGGSPGAHYVAADAETARRDEAAVVAFVDDLWSRLQEAAT